MKGNNTTNSTSTIWHMVFGWIDFINDKRYWLLIIIIIIIINRLLDCLCHLRSQLSLLWSSSLIKTLFEPLYAMSLTEGGGGGGGKRSDGGGKTVSYIVMMCWCSSVSCEETVQYLITTC